MIDEPTLSDLFDPTSLYFNGAVYLPLPPSSQAAFSSVNPFGLPFGDINGNTLTLTARLSAINSSIITDFEASARFQSVVTGTGAVTFGNDGLDITTGATNPSTAATTWQPNTLNVFKGSPVFSCTVEPRLETGGIVFVGLGNLTSFSATASHIGFKIIGDILYATQANGGTETAVMLTTVVPGDVFNLICKLNGDSSVDYYYRKYYNNDTAVYTNAFSGPINITTTIPTSVTGKISFLVDNNATTNTIRALFAGATYTV